MYLKIKWFYLRINQKKYNTLKLITKNKNKNNLKIKKVKKINIIQKPTSDN